MSTRRDHESSEDMFSETRMTFGEHLEELRVHLIRALSGFGIALGFSLAFLGRPMLKIISAPVTKQLEAFFKAHSLQVVEDLDSNRDIQEANRARWIGISVPPTLLDQIQRGAGLRAWPPENQPLAFSELVERGYLALTYADNAQKRGQWERLTELAAEFAKIGANFTNASEVPEVFTKKRLESLAKELSARADELQSGAQAQDRGRTRAALRHLGRAIPLDEFPERLLTSYLIRIDDPVLIADALNDATSQITNRFGLAALSIQEGIMAWFKVSMVCGLVIGCPWIFYQIWLFIAAGLYPNEKRLVNVYLPISVGLFLIGVLICQLFVIPKAIEALLWFNEWLGIKPDLRFNEWLGFAIMMPVVFGVSFQLPLVMMFVERIGLLTVEMYVQQWKIAFFVLHVFAALITPSVDIVSMELLALPMFGLYWLGILLCKMRPHHDDNIDVPDNEEPVGV